MLFGLAAGAQTKLRRVNENYPSQVAAFCSGSCPAARHVPGVNGAALSYQADTPIVGYPPGTAPGMAARLIGQRLSEQLGKSVIIENRAGASSNLAAELVVRAPPDGYTLFQLTSVNSWNVALYDI